MSRSSCLFVLRDYGGRTNRHPRIGYIVDSKNFLRPVYGVAGAFTLALRSKTMSSPLPSRAETLVVKKDVELLVDEERFEAPQGPDRSSIRRKGELREIFFPDDGDAMDLARWRVRRKLRAPA